MEPEQKIGGYRILSPLGAGGMGEVWRAEDEKLGREVALKVLPPDVADDPDRLARFEREAKVLASLNHQNIATLFGLEFETPEKSNPAGLEDPQDSISREDVTFLVMELVEGEDLSERINRGPIPSDEAIPIALQIAEALEAAHESGIVHRDLKPANIKLRPDGTVKVLDFGLAKAWETRNADTSLSLSPTMTQHATAAGVILGTAAYMSPEQAAGTEADRRADIWAFGVVLWEMLTGHKLFDGETVSHVLASVLKDEVELDELPEDTPPTLRELISRCLQRKPRQRLQAIGEARILLEGYQRDPETFDEPITGGRRDVDASSASISKLPWIVASIAMVLIAFSVWFASNSGTDERKVLRARIPAPEGASFGLEAFAPGAGTISPDGSRIVFTVTDADGERMLWVRHIDHLAARPLPGTSGAAYPFWAPDSRQAAYFSGDGKLKKIDTTGGPPVTICVAPNGKGGSWNEEDQIVFAPAHNTPIHLVAAAGGDVRPVSDMAEGISSHRFPLWLPGGRFTYLARSSEGAENDRILVASVDKTGSDRELLAAGSNVAVAAGHLLFIREGTLMAQPFDADNAVFVGDAVPVAEDTLYIAGARFGAFSVSQTGLLIYNMGLVEMLSEIVWLDRRGEDVQMVSTGDLLFDVMISPDGRSAAVAQLEVSVGSPDIWIYDLERGLSTRFTFHPSNDWYPAWSPDGSRLAFASARSGNEDIWVKEVGGSSEAELLKEGGEHQVFPRGWSPDGEWLIYEQVDPTNNTDLYAVRADGSETVALVASSFTETFSSVSPDGRWLAFVSNESGANQVYVTTFPRPARRWQISTDGGSFPRWHANSKELFFARTNGELYSVEVDGSGETLDVGRIQRLFSWNIAPGFRWPYDVAADGERFLVIRGLAAAQTDPMAVVLNWDAELEKDRR